jgi:hypothetical protein
MCAEAMYTHSSLQGSLTALVTCTDETKTWQGIHSATGIVEQVYSSRLFSYSYALKLSNFPDFDTTASAFLPSSSSCDAPLCTKHGAWLLQYHDTFVSPLLFRLDFNGSNSGVHDAGALTEASIFDSVEICLDNGKKCSKEVGKAGIMLVLPAASSCVAVVGELEAMPPEMKALMQSADLCPTKDRLSQTWPDAASDAFASHQCAQPLR